MADLETGPTISVCEDCALPVEVESLRGELRAAVHSIAVVASEMKSISGHIHKMFDIYSANQVCMSDEYRRNNDDLRCQIETLGSILLRMKHDQAG